MTDLRKAAEMALEALDGLQTWSNGWLKFTDEIQALRQALAQPEHEPVWSAEECARVLKTLRYIQGIAERGEGRAMRDDETLEQFVLGYVKKLEQPEQWDGPTDEEYENFCSLIQKEEAKLKEKNT